MTADIFDSANNAGIIFLKLFDQAVDIAIGIIQPFQIGIGLGFIFWAESFQIVQRFAAHVGGDRVIDPSRCQFINHHLQELLADIAAFVPAETQH
ncbi:hypothetical protein PN498_17790 [Oscillatoria sp. CS-180]|uniref:hypothetical protein n=1 Tax=Oscillatoria sp. CS-180 TaxID=3021720 RepID=UPI002330CA0A|nr:hypothetical protein [Oscillatoria sp. CS-180]MDB9527852.1 hypothetical protein [Oscillatoria sp. CS-180]